MSFDAKRAVRLALVLAATASLAACASKPKDTPGPGYTAVSAQVLVSRDGKVVSSLHPEHRTLIYPHDDSAPAAVAVIGANVVVARVTWTGTDSAVLGLVWHPLL